MASLLSASSVFPKEVTSLVEVDGIPTEIICTTFADCFFVVVTQIGKFGTIIRAESSEKADGGYIFAVNTLLGKRDDPLLTIYARQIIERISPYSKNPLVLTISLKEEGRSKNHFEAIVNKILETLVIKSV